MKKILIVVAVVVAAVSLSSCDSKLCYCYDNGREETLYVNPDVACNAYSSGRRGCVEANERMHGGIAEEYKKAVKE